MGLVLYDLLLRMKYPIHQQEIVVYGREGGERCNIFLGSTQYDDTRILDEDEAEIIEFCRERLASYKCPQSVDFTQALPRNPTGKVLKRELREPYWEGRQRRVN